MTANIRHEPESQRFVIDTAGGSAVIHYREVGDRVLDLDHTFVPVAARGGGIAARLTEHALGYARAHGLKVVASCPYVAAYIERHPEQRELLA